MKEEDKWDLIEVFIKYKIYKDNKKEELTLEDFINWLISTNI